MSDPVIRIENLGKKYIIDRQQTAQYSTLSETISNGVRNLFKPALDLQARQERTPKQEDFWALKDLSLEINQGDRVGIIGRNGAGKSTLLKILSRITEPTCGSIRIRGKVASLLEVGTGFHPELTGRENIFLNGAILGMSKSDIARKFDKIVDFAEVEKFLDTPVKRYSSGMYVRLAFAVAAHLEPDILIVDEVLAVGDSQFQKKCLGKMQDISQGQGRTVLFVSHSIDAIRRLCSQCILLDRGRAMAYGSTESVLAHYLANNICQTRPDEWIDLSNVNRSGNGRAKFSAIRYSSLDRSVAFQPYSGGCLEFTVDVESSLPQSVGSLAVSIWSQAGNILVNADTLLLERNLPLQSGHNYLVLKIEKLHLKAGNYQVWLWLDRGNGLDPFDYIECAFEIEVVNPISDRKVIPILGCVTCDFSISAADRAAIGT
jgi:lipopolysaccharide transport system ATP-binding protein